METRKDDSYFSLYAYKMTLLKERHWLFEKKPLRKNPKIAKLFMPKNRLSKFIATLANPYDSFLCASKLKNYCILGLGGNQGNVLVTFWQLFKRIQNKKNVIIHQSLFYKNPAFGYKAQADFYNAIVWVKTQQGYGNFFSYMMYLERLFGRERKRIFKNAPRSLDIDILGFKNKKITLKHLQIPHKEWANRESVKIPLLGRQ